MLAEPPDGQQFDASKVNVQFTSSTGVIEKIFQVPAAAGCASVGGAGWYYDDPGAPTKVQLCPATCTEVEGASDGGPPTTGATAPRLDVLFGCVTHVAVPA